MASRRVLGRFLILLAMALLFLAWGPGRVGAGEAENKYPDPTWKRLRGNASITLGRAMGPPKDQVGPSEEPGGDGRPDAVIEAHIEEALEGVLYVEVVTTGQEEFAWDTRSGNEKPLCRILDERGPLFYETDRLGFGDLPRDKVLTILIQDDKHLTWRGGQRTFILLGLPFGEIKYLEVFIIFTD